MSIKERPIKKKEKEKEIYDEKANSINNSLDNVPTHQFQTKDNNNVEIYPTESIINENETKFQQFELSLPTWISKPWMYVQPSHPNHLKSWYDSWKALILEYSRIVVIHVINITELMSQHPFNNLKSNKQLSKINLQAIINDMVREGLAKWLDDNQVLVRIFYKTNEQWSIIIMDYLIDTGLAAEVLTLYEIENLDQEWSSLPRSELIEIFDIIVNQKRANWVGKEKDTLSFII